MIETPEHVLRAITANVEVHGFVFVVVACPDFLGPRAFPALRDGIANEEQLRVRCFFQTLVQELRTILPAAIGARCRLGDGLLLAFAERRLLEDLAPFGLGMGW